MKATKIFLTLLIFSIAVAFIGCPTPIGGLQHSLDYIRAEPKKFVYPPNVPFVPKEEVEVFGAFGGKEQPIAIKQVEIVVRGYPWSSEDEVIVLDEDDKIYGIQFDPSFPGVKNVIISYRGKEALYRISVGETDTGEINSGDGEDGPGIVIIPDWPD
jgi:hypothetical protein